MTEQQFQRLRRLVRDTQQLLEVIAKKRYTEKRTPQQLETARRRITVAQKAAETRRKNREKRKQ